MIEILEGFPDGVVGVAAHGRVTGADYAQVLVPAIEAAFRRRDRLRVYYELGPDCAGFEPAAMWEDAKLGFEHLTHWERIAVVSDIEWVRLGVTLFRPFLPGRVRVFAMNQTTEARAWIASV